MDLQLHNKEVLVTGGTSGIGLSSAEFFLQEGARVMISGRNTQRGNESLQQISGMQGNKELSLYCASKGAITIMSKALAVDLAFHNIRVNCVCPGDIHTPMLDADLKRKSDPAGYLKGLTERYPIGRLGRVEEVARVIVCLASDASPFTTGAAWSVDGGITAY